MAGFKNKLGPIKVCLERDQVNALLSMLDTMVLGGNECAFGDMAKALRDKITHYGKPIRRGELDEVQIYFFDNEAEKMISLMSLYLALTARDIHDYYPEIGHRYCKGFGNSQAAELTETT